MEHAPYPVSKMPETYSFLVGRWLIGVRCRSVILGEASMDVLVAVSCAESSAGASTVLCLHWTLLLQESERGVRRLQARLGGA